VKRSKILVFAARICYVCDTQVIYSHLHGIPTFECKYIINYACDFKLLWG